MLQGRVAIITGAASARGIGKATANALAAQGAYIAILDLDAVQTAAAASDNWSVPVISRLIITVFGRVKEYDS